MKTSEKIIVCTREAFADVVSKIMTKKEYNEIFAEDPAMVLLLTLFSTEIFTELSKTKEEQKNDTL